MVLIRPETLAPEEHRHYAMFSDISVPGLTLALRYRTRGLVSATHVLARQCHTVVCTQAEVVMRMMPVAGTGRSASQWFSESMSR